MFNSSPISPRTCRTLLTKIAVLLFTGEQFPTNEATSLFFGISKLFQNKDPSLRQMVYLVLKELSGTAEDVIMSTSIIMKDTAVGSDVLYRANAIRALCRIIDVRFAFSFFFFFFFQMTLINLVSLRHPPCKVSNDSSKRPLSTRTLPSRLLPWYRHITFSPLPGTWCADGKAKPKRQHRRRSSRPDSWGSRPARQRTPSRRQTT